MPNMVAMALSAGPSSVDANIPLAITVLSWVEGGDPNVQPVHSEVPVNFGLTAALFNKAMVDKAIADQLAKNGQIVGVADKVQLFGGII